MRLVFALLFLSALFTASTSSSPALGSGAGLNDDGRGVIGSGT